MTSLFGPLGRRNVISSLTLCQYSREIISWFDANYFALNVGESQFLIFFSRIGIAFPQLTQIQVSQGSLCRPDYRVVRFLGILLDEKLSFRNHIAMIRVKVSWSLGIIQKLRHIFPGSILKLLFSALSSLPAIRFLLPHCMDVYFSVYTAVAFCHG